MSADKKYTAAIIGTGRIGFTLGFDKKREQPASHTFALKQNRRIKLVAGCDVDEARLNLWGKENKRCRLYSCAKDLFIEERKIAGGVPDIVAIAVNEAFHHEIALAAIKEQPKLVVLEKPVALSSLQAMEIKEAARKNAVPVMINHERRFSRDYILARSLLGKIGELQSFSASLHSNLKVWSSKEEESGFYSLLHDGTHLVDVTLFLLRGVSCDKAVELRNPRPFGFLFDKDKDLRNLSVSYDCDVCPSVTFNFSGRSDFFGFELDILGTLGRVRMGNGFMEFYESTASRLYTGFRSLEKKDGSYPLMLGDLVESGRIRRGKFRGKTGYFSGMVQNAVDYLDGRAPLGSTIDDGIAVLCILEEMKELLKTEASKIK